VTSRGDKTSEWCRDPFPQKNPRVVQDPQGPEDKVSNLQSVLVV